jgi:hypothetical protein
MVRRLHLSNFEKIICLPSLLRCADNEIGNVGARWLAKAMGTPWAIPNVTSLNLEGKISFKKTFVMLQQGVLLVKMVLLPWRGHLRHRDVVRS